MPGKAFQGTETVSHSVRCTWEIELLGNTNSHLLQTTLGFRSKFQSSTLCIKLSHQRPKTLQLSPSIDLNWTLGPHGINYSPFNLRTNNSLQDLWISSRWTWWIRFHTCRHWKGFVSKWFIEGVLSEEIYKGVGEQNREEAETRYEWGLQVISSLNSVPWGSSGAYTVTWSLSCLETRRVL